MLNKIICGAVHLHHEEEDDQPRSSGSSPSSTPRKSRKNGRDSKNPYATRGLDKFSALLAELEEKRQRIYSKTGSEDISLVRFAYSSSNNCVPIVVKTKDHKQDKTKTEKNKDKAMISVTRRQVADDKLHVEANSGAEKEGKVSSLKTDKKAEKKYRLLKLKLHRLRRPSYYMPVAIILILVLLALFGRSVAVLCTSIGWYVVPILSSQKPAKKKKLERGQSEINTNYGSTKKKEYMRGFSEIKMVSDGLSPPRRDNSLHRRSF